MPPSSLLGFDDTDMFDLTEAVNIELKKPAPAAAIAAAPIPSWVPKAGTILTQYPRAPLGTYDRNGYKASSSAYATTPLASSYGAVPYTPSSYGYGGYGGYGLNYGLNNWAAAPAATTVAADSSTQYSAAATTVAANWGNNWNTGAYSGFGGAYNGGFGGAYNGGFGGAYNGGFGGYWGR
jgi:hypothetical protein